MPASTYVALSTTTLTSAQSTVTFTNIPQNYTDLFIVANFGCTVGADLYMRFNGDTASNYSATRFFGFTSGVQSNRTTSDTGIQPRTPANQATTPTTIWNINVMNYSNAVTNKTTIARYGYGFEFTETDVGLWRNTQPITSIALIANSTTFTVGSTFSLYGISANTVKATGGNIIANDGTYWYHAFTSSGTFTPASTLSCDVLVIAGGGGGSTGIWGGGSGAGGYRSTTGLSISSATSVIVGAGGAPASNGSDSTFSTLTSSGGGYGGSNGGLGNPGGSGGGASGYASAGAGAASSPVTSPVQGYAGGRSGYNGGNGGGGAGGVGSGSPSTPNEAGGNGGVGSNSFATWASVTNTGIDGYYAGGGGGAGGGGNDTGGVGYPGIGGLGGGGIGANGSGGRGGNGARATGGGAGGTWGGGNGAIGGSGIVIVRYAV